VAFERDSKLSVMDCAAFANCSYLSSICIPSSLETLGQSCFYRCESLSMVTFESGSLRCDMGSSVFLQCSSLSSIRIP
jgi:hypothetical protein